VLDSRLRGNDALGGGFGFSDKVPAALCSWIPACAGMTRWGFLFFLIDSCGFSMDSIIPDKFL
ncbi:hypothetical protein, partial [Neisseria meningitidis]|uniref:hypothetical protein n=1 Tax=Neisseria meningitidis TaxID=487 RepID=UPI001E29C80C